MTKGSRAIQIFREAGSVVALLLICIFMAIYAPGFAEIDNVRNVLRQASIIAVVAAGMTCVIITAGIDLSVGSVLCLAACVSSGLVIYSHWAWLPAVLAGIGVGAVFGFVNGLLITKIDLPPFIATLGTMGIARGLAKVYTGGGTIYGLPDQILWLGRGDIWGIPAPVILFALVYVVFYLLLRETQFGRICYAIGGNEQAAILSGIPVDRYKLIVYTLTGILAAFGGLIMVGRIEAASSTLGIGQELDVIAAVVIGGASLAGGRGGIFGTLIGVLIMGIVRNGLNLMLVSAHWQDVVIGGIVLVAVAIDSLQRKWIR